MTQASVANVFAGNTLGNTLAGEMGTHLQASAMSFNQNTNMAHSNFMRTTMGGGHIKKNEEGSDDEVN